MTYVEVLFADVHSCCRGDWKRVLPHGRQPRWSPFSAVRHWQKTDVRLSIGSRRTQRHTAPFHHFSAFAISSQKNIRLDCNGSYKQQQKVRLIYSYSYDVKTSRRSVLNEKTAAWRIVFLRLRDRTLKRFPYVFSFHFNLYSLKYTS